MNHAKIIIEHFDPLCKLTDCSLQFLNRCRSASVLNQSETEKLKGLKDYERVSTFYNILEVKNRSDIANVLKICLDPDTKQNSIVCAVLQECLEVPEGFTSDNQAKSRRVEQKDANWITNYLVDDPAAVLGQDGFFLNLGLRPAQLIELRQKANQSGSPTFYFFLNTLTKWICTTKTGTTFEHLEEALTKSEFFDVSRKIMADPKAK
jgi:hypothetical protein